MRRATRPCGRCWRGSTSRAGAGVDVVNLSLSTDSPLPPSFDPLSRTLERLWDDLDVTVVVAAGNDGPGWGTVASPGNTPTVITVGALDEKATEDREGDTVAEFSSRGTVYDATKPDLVAPGVSLVSTAAPGSIARPAEQGLAGGRRLHAGLGHLDVRRCGERGGRRAPVEAPDGLTPDAVKVHLEDTARKTPRLGEMDGAGAGALDLGEALRNLVKLDAVQDEPDVVPGEFGPDEKDAKRWAAFAALWAANDGSTEAGAELLAAWQALSPHQDLGRACMVDGRRRQQPRRESARSSRPAHGRRVPGRLRSGSPGPGRPAHGPPAPGATRNGWPAHGPPAPGATRNGWPAHGPPAPGATRTGLLAHGPPAPGVPGHGPPAHGPPAPGVPGHGPPAHGQPARGVPGHGPPAPGRITPGRHGHGPPGRGQTTPGRWIRSRFSSWDEVALGRRPLGASFLVPSVRSSPWY